MTRPSRAAYQVLDEKQGLDGGAAEAVEAIRSQRERFLAEVSGLSGDTWHADTRCAGWSVHDVVRHVRDVAALGVFQLGGPRPDFLVSDRFRFHPARTPQEWLEFSAAEQPADTVRDLARVVDLENALLRRKADDGSQETVPGPLRRRLHWSVAAVHILWDAWMHERDILLPRGVSPACPESELRVVTLYGLMAAAAPSAWSGEHLVTSLELKGGPDARYSVAQQDGTVRVTGWSAAGPGDLAGGCEEVLDSLAGRGPEVAAVLTGSDPAALEKLARLRAVAT
ncbi:MULTISPECIES: maleylpyruvate isomerase family mycothiol-dependent enzyme [unclassified Streptomyces]|uniref:maleylpyruvate isomerase family mycothiol-dependent enzyme n=1 Tax=unclassified Streptomyces TaxID=2593676 RepID=UPI0033BE0516